MTEVDTTRKEAPSKRRAGHSRVAQDRRDRRDRDRLDQPQEMRRGLLPRFRLDGDRFGVFAEGFARFMGTAQFLVGMTIFITVWITLNLVGIFGYRWDSQPFILLNLIFSTQASYAAPLILLAQNRQDDRDRVSLEQDRSQNARSLADTEFLTREVASLRVALREQATRDFVRSEFRSLLEEMEERGYLQTPVVAEDPAPASPSCPTVGG